MLKHVYLSKNKIINTTWVEIVSVFKCRAEKNFIWRFLIAGNEWQSYWKGNSEPDRDRQWVNDRLIEDRKKLLPSRHELLMKRRVWKY